jgi:hypothetical protein
MAVYNGKIDTDATRKGLLKHSFERLKEIITNAASNATSSIDTHPQYDEINYIT